jgi:hypothetical protein
MFGLGKKKAFRTEAIRLMYLWVPAMGKRDLELFGVLMKHHFDGLYAEKSAPHVAALTIGGLFFLQVVQSAKAKDQAYFKYMAPYAAWLGACAEHVLKNTDFLTDEIRPEVERALLEAQSLYLPSQGETTLGEEIEIVKLTAGVVKHGMEKMNEMRGIK